MTIDPPEKRQRQTVKGHGIAVTDAQWATISAIAAHYEISKSNAVRYLLDLGIKTYASAAIAPINFQEVSNG